MKIKSGIIIRESYEDGVLDRALLGKIKELNEGIKKALGEKK